MKRFYIAAVIVGVTLVALSVNVLPVRCMDCGRILFRTNAWSALCGGCNSYSDVCFTNRKPGDLTPTGIAAGTPATEIAPDTTVERPS
ncbi:MAG: hypothetical protein MUF48_22015 [Pirellulaceae bacterium]|jgi:hypothetical protein|nr:hypothetical protein [Pirellulaceae bacterium]